MKSADEAKLKLFGMLAADPDLDLRSQVQKLERPVSTLRRWKKDYLLGLTEAKMETLVNADTIILDRVVEEVSNEITAVIADVEDLEIDEATGEILPASEVALRREQANIEKQRVADIRAVRSKNRITGLAALNVEVQAVAGDLINLITERTITDSDENGLPLSIRDISMLTKSLTDIQNAFFNKPTTNITVATQTNVGSNMLAELKGSLTA